MNGKQTKQKEGGTKVVEKRRMCQIPLKRSKKTEENDNRTREILRNNMKKRCQLVYGALENFRKMTELSFHTNKLYDKHTK